MGMLHIYCGTGKGKTTAALGLALRAAGSGIHVDLVQFLKYGDESALNCLQNIPEITASRCSERFGFTWQLTDIEKQRLAACHNTLLCQTMERLFQGDTDMLVLDEFFSAYSYGLLDRALADKLVFTGREHGEIVLTGRDPEPKFLNAADYVSEIREVKHPYRKGVSARRGIEY